MSLVTDMSSYATGLKKYMLKWIKCSKVCILFPRIEFISVIKYSNTKRIIMKVTIM